MERDDDVMAETKPGAGERSAPSAGQALRPAARVAVQRAGGGVRGDVVSQDRAVLAGALAAAQRGVRQPVEARTGLHGAAQDLQGLDAAELEAALRRLASEQVEQTTAPVGRAVIALDGKVLRGSLARFEDRRAAQVLSALAVQEQVVLGHVLIEDGSKDHEIAAAQRLIAELGLSDCLYTLDALHSSCPD